MARTKQGEDGGEEYEKPCPKSKKKVRTKSQVDAAKAARLEKKRAEARKKRHEREKKFKSMGAPFQKRSVQLKLLFWSASSMFQMPRSECFFLLSGKTTRSCTGCCRMNRTRRQGVPGDQINQRSHIGGDPAQQL